MFPSKFFFRGREDLGNGLRATFSLDSMISISTGELDPQSGGALFENSAWVALGKAGIGDVRFGRQNDFNFDDFLITGIDPATGIAGGMLNFRTGSFGSDLVGHPGYASGGPFAPITNAQGIPNGMGAIDWDRVGGKRMSSAIKFMSDDFGGFSGGVMYSMGGVAGDFNNSSGKSASLMYCHGDTRATVVYTVQNWPLINAGHGGLANLTAGARTRFGGLSVTGLYAQARNTESGARISALATGAGYDLTSAVNVGVAYTYEFGNNLLKNVRVNQVAVQGTHTLSRRTRVYLTSVYQHTNGAYAAEIGNIVSSGKVQSVTELGLLTSF
ncbi:porin [Paraburkholderia aromaticivorans]|uniref:porin n=1 Tax=Paraburkholderia aromaticivorans TaxID=2026199 RepID=UPI001F110162|nr:porin [Paraburkholderia aromaticivorans]